VKRWVALAIAVAVIAACSSSSKFAKNSNTTTTASSRPTTASAAIGWAPAQLAAAKQLADKLRAQGIECRGYAPDDYKKWVAGNPTLPIPGAVAECASAGNENLTFETFAGEGPAYEFMGTKIGLVCTSKSGVHPSFPYVASLTWFVEPDAKATGDRVAAAEGGPPSVQSRVTSCPK
jgi:hypothetical protein